MNSTSDFDEIKALNDGECYIVPESDYGKAEVWLKNNRYFLFEIPMYGGIPQFHSVFAVRDKSINEMIKIIYSWT